MIDEAYCPVSVTGGGNDAGPGLQTPQLLRKLRLAQDQTVHIEFQCPANEIRLMATNDHGVCLGEEETLPTLGQGNDHLSADQIHRVLSLIEELALQDAQQVEYWHPVQPGLVDGLHVILRNILRQKHTVQRPVILGHRNPGQAAIFLQQRSRPGNHSDRLPPRAGGVSYSRSRTWVYIELIRTGG